MCPEENSIAQRLLFHSSVDIMAFSIKFHLSMNFVSENSLKIYEYKYTNEPTVDIQ